MSSQTLQNNNTHNKWAKFIDKFAKDGTKHVYSLSAKGFFSVVLGKAIDFKDLESASDQYFADRCKVVIDPTTGWQRTEYDVERIKEDIRDFINSLKNLEPKTIRNRIAGVRSFLGYLGVPILPQWWKDNSNHNVHPVTQDKAPTPEELRRIIHFMRPLGKAFYLMASSSGMRFSECLTLEFDDVDLNSTPATITIQPKHTKTGQGRITFFSTEAVAALKAYLEVREDDIKSAISKCTGGKKAPNVESNRIFPFSRCTLATIWTVALQKADLAKKDKATGFHIFHVHTTRKFFRTQMEGVIPKGAIERMLGHSGYLDQEYLTISQEKLAEFYLKGESSILVSSQAIGQAKGFDQEKFHLLATIKDQQREILSQQGELEEVRQLANDLKAQLDMVQRVMARWEVEKEKAAKSQ
jgi:integrase